VQHACTKEYEVEMRIVADFCTEYYDTANCNKLSLQFFVLVEK